MLKKISQLLQAIESHWSLLRLIFAAFASATMTFLTALTNILDKYAPLSYGVTFLLSFLIISVAYLIFAFSQSVFQEARIRKTVFSGEPANVNPLDDVFTKKRIELAKFVDPLRRVVKNKTFVDCEFVGPAVLFFGDCNLEIAYAHDCDFSKVMGGTKVNNGYLFMNCTFKQATLIRCTLLIPDALSKENIFDSVNWITQR